MGLISSSIASDLFVSTISTRQVNAPVILIVISGGHFRQRMSKVIQKGKITIFLAHAPLRGPPFFYSS